MCVCLFVQSVTLPFVDTACASMFSLVMKKSGDSSKRKRPDPDVNVTEVMLLYRRSLETDIYSEDVTFRSVKDTNGSDCKPGGGASLAH
jgi:hypothetical protein